MLPAGFQRGIMRSALLLNVGIIADTFVVTDSPAHYNGNLHDHAVINTLPCPSFERTKMISEMESFLRPDQAYWCSGNTTADKNTPSS